MIRSPEVFVGLSLLAVGFVLWTVEHRRKTQLLCFKVPDMMCLGGCGSTIERTLLQLKHVSNVSLDIEKKHVFLQVDEGFESQLAVDAMNQVGFESYLA